MAIKYITLICIFFSVQFVFHKLYQKNTNGSFNASAWMLLVSSLSVILFLMPGSYTELHYTKLSFILALFYSLFFLICTFATIPAMQMGNLATVTMFTLIGSMVIPFLYGVICLGEKLSLSKFAGVTLIILSLLPDIIISGSKGKKNKQTKGRFLYIILCMLIFLSNGAVSVCLKVLAITEDTVTNSGFLILTAIMRLALAVIIIVMIPFIRRRKNKQAIIRKTDFVGIGNLSTPKTFFISMLLGALYAVANMLGNIFSIECAALMDSSVQFPVVSASVIVLTSLISLLVFREKLKYNNLISISLAIIGIAVYAI